MKVRSNPAHGAAVMWPFMPGVFVGASRDIEASKKAGAPRFAFDTEPVDLGADFFAREPRAYAYFISKVKDGELLAADAEMAKAAGVPLEAAKPAAKSQPAPALDPAK